MTREHKAGIAVSCTFLCLAGTVAWLKTHEAPPLAGPAAPVVSISPSRPEPSPAPAKPSPRGEKGALGKSGKPGETGTSAISLAKEEKAGGKGGIPFGLQALGQNLMNPPLPGTGKVGTSEPQASPPAVAAAPNTDLGTGNKTIPPPLTPKSPDVPKPDPTPKVEPTPQGVQLVGGKPVPPDLSLGAPPSVLAPKDATPTAAPVPPPVPPLVNKDDLLSPPPPSTSLVSNNATPEAIGVGSKPPVPVPGVGGAPELATPVTSMPKPTDPPLAPSLTTPVPPPLASPTPPPGGTATPAAPMPDATPVIKPVDPPAPDPAKPLDHSQFTPDKPKLLAPVPSTGSSTEPLTPEPTTPGTRPLPPLPDVKPLSGTGSAPAPGMGTSPAPAPLPAVSAVIVSDETLYPPAPGDTFAKISKDKFGSEAYAEALRRFNADHPGASVVQNADGTLASSARLYIPSFSYLQEKYSSFITTPGAGAVRPVAATSVPAPPVPPPATATPPPPLSTGR